MSESCHVVARRSTPAHARTLGYFRRLKSDVVRDFVRDKRLSSIYYESSCDIFQSTIVIKIVVHNYLCTEIITDRGTLNMIHFTSAHLTLINCNFATSNVNFQNDWKYFMSINYRLCIYTSTWGSIVNYDTRKELLNMFYNFQVKTNNYIIMTRDPGAIW